MIRRNPAIIFEEKLTLKECLIGDREFYHKVLTLVLPMIIQNTLSNVVGLLDNVMVGQVGTLPMSAVAIVNQLMFIYYLSIWGGTAGAGIYGAQFFGKGDMDGVRITWRVKFVMGLVLTGIAFAIFLTAGVPLVSLYVSADTSAADAATTLSLASSYMHWMLVGLIPFSISNAYAGTLRESGNTKLPMIASISAMLVNFVLNLILIFGLLGFPAMGVTGAAIATVISRYVELAIVAIGSHLATHKYPFIKGIYRHFVIPLDLLKKILSKSAPLLANEIFWSVGEATILQQYSLRGIAVIAAMNIANTVAQLFNEIFLTLGNGTGILVGQYLGANKLREAVRTAYRMITTSVISCFGMGFLLFLAAPIIPGIYNTEPEIRVIATQILIVSAIVMPMRGAANSEYFTLRAGGKTWITLVFDSCYSWFVMVPAAFIIGRFTTLNIVWMYSIVCGLDIFKIVFGFFLVYSGGWVKNIVKNIEM